MSKLYGYFVSDRTKITTKGGNEWINTTLQTSFVRTKVTMENNGWTTISIYQMHGYNNEGELIRQITISSDGKTVNDYEPRKYK